MLENIMHYSSTRTISTTSLAKLLSLSTNETFQLLQTLNLIYRKDDCWCLTNDGIAKGGEYKNGIHGRYIAWPSAITVFIDDENNNSSHNLINATSIGREFNLSSNRVNSIFYEHCFEKKAPVKGWVLTEIGKKFGGVQDKHKISGIPFVRWPKSILSEPIFTDTILQTKGESTIISEPEPQYNAADNPGFRDKFEAKLRTIDGHLVRSKSEVIIDNWLYQFRIAHAYERKLPVAEVYCDFYLPDGNVYIEYWGLDSDVYKKRREKKVQIYEQNNYNLIELDDNDICNLDDVLPRKLRDNGIPFD
jgi:hypothetical protein